MNYNNRKLFKSYLIQNMMVKKIGQITIKKIGRKFAVCISGTPQELRNSWSSANALATRLRKKYKKGIYCNKK